MPDAPHILFINTDQLRADVLSCAGFPVQTTPHLDRLAAEGTRFSEAFTVCPICTPARYSLTTGQYVSSHGALTNRHGTYPTVTSLLEPFNAHGYHTAVIGKLHHNPPDLPFGFQDVFLHDGTFPSRRQYSIYSNWLLGEGIDEDELAYPADIDDDPEKRRLKNRLHWGRCRLPEQYNESSFLTRFAQGYLNNYRRDEPLLLYLSFLAPHSPYCPPAPYDTRFRPEDMPCPPRENEAQLAKKHRSVTAEKATLGELGIPDATMQAVRAQYAGLTAYLDHCIGEAITAFRARFGEDALICVTSDHGDFLGEHHRCEKHQMYDGAVRVPYLVCWPGHVPAGVVSDALFPQIDMLPTLLGLTGVEWNGARTAGRDRSREVLAGAADGPRYVFAENYDSVGRGAVYTAMARSRHHKLILYTDVDPARGNWWEFYDLVADPHELENVIDAPAYTDEIAAHRHALLEWCLACRRNHPPAGFKS